MPNDMSDRRAADGPGACQAREALLHDDVPIGAVVVRDADGAVVGAGHNEREVRQDPTAHAEVLALREAARGRARGGCWTARSS